MLQRFFVLMMTIILESHQYERLETLLITRLGILIVLIVINFDVTLQFEIATH